MEIMEIISDGLHYPLDHVKELGIYILLYFIMAIILIITGVGVLAGANAENVAAAGGVGIIGLILAFIITLLISGYGLDIVKIAIDRSNDAPSIDIARQVINGIKCMIVGFVYLIIPFIVLLILSSINDTLGFVVGIILFIIFGFALLMAECRLAKTESLGYALNIGEAAKDIMKAGIIKILAVIIVIMIVGGILSWIAGIFGDFGFIGSIISAILSAIVSAYMFFFQNRAAGLLYSDVE